MDLRERTGYCQASRSNALRSRLLFAVLSAFWLAAIGQNSISAPQDSPIAIKAEIDRQQAYVGDILRLTVSAITDSVTSIDTMPIHDNIGDFEVISRDYNLSTGEFGLLEHTIRFRLAAYRTGLLWVPRIPVRLIQSDGTVTEMTTDSLSVVVMSVASGDSFVDIRGLKPPIYFGVRFPWYYLALAAVLLLGLLFWFLKRRSKATADVAPVDTRPPWAIAEEAMSRLRESGLLAGGEFKLFYSRLTEILRAYIEPRFGIDALDRTTAELRTEMKRMNLEDRLHDLLFALFDSADLVKFAKFRPTADQAERDFQAGWLFVHETSQKSAAGVTGA